MNDDIKMLQTRIRNLEEVLMNLVVCVEQGHHIDYSEKLQEMINQAKSVIEGEFEE